MKLTPFIVKSSFYVIFLLIHLSIYSQEKKNSIQISGIAVQYQNYEEKHLIGPFKGYYENEISPGMECLYNRQISKSINISTGLSYNFGKNSSYFITPTRFRFQELSIPLLFNINFLGHKRGYLNFNTGLYFGRTLNIEAELPSKYDRWTEELYYEYLKGYSDDVNFIDLYFDLGYSIRLNKEKAVNISPFIKYRANKTWLNTHQKETQYGIKLSYSFKI